MALRPIVFACLLLLSSSPAKAASFGDALRISGARGGIVVHLHCGDAHDTAAADLGEAYYVHGLDVDASNVAAARERLHREGLYGRIAVAAFDGRTLPYADNTVNMIAADALGDVPLDEALRALVPGGVLVVDGEKTVKPRPADIDDWPQYLNKADNNAVAMDTVAGPPRRIQWVDKPTWCRSHMGAPTVASVVTGGGRLFAIEDSAPSDNPFLPARFQIVARDAFNGKELWRRPMNRWEAVTMYIKCQPVQQQRRMAVVGDTLYCTLELEGPLSALDAATGETIRVYEETSPTQEVAYDQGIVYLNVGDRFPSAAYNIVKLKDKPFVEGVDPSQPFHGGGFREGYAPETRDKERPTSSIVAIDPETGEHLWAVRGLVKYTAGSLGVKGDYAVYQSADGLFCVHSKTGEPTWSVEKPIINAVGHDSLTPGAVPNTVVIADDKVFAVEGASATKISSYPDNTVYVYSLKDGRLLWSAPALGNYESSSDVFFVDGAVWLGGVNPTQHDAETGAVLKTIVQKMTGPMGHDRCYRNLITERYFINSKTGGADFLDLDTSAEFPNHWTRGGCGMGVLPANGLVYATPYSCQCSVGAMFQGMNAYAPAPTPLAAPDQPFPIAAVPRLEKGPAYGEPRDASPVDDADWPSFRHDGARSGITSSDVPTSPSTQWRTKLPTRPSAMTVASGKVFVADIDTHTLHALDAATGDIAWTFTADGRIDSPPTILDGVAYFGSRDGWVYAVRVSDGALAWRFKDLPDRLVGAVGQLESAWPVHGAVVLLDGKLYFAAGRSSYLDGGIFIYALDPNTGRLLHRRANYGPFDDKNGFPIGGDAGFKNDVLVTDGENLYLRQKAFDRELNDVEGGPHIIPSAGFLDGDPQHRTNWMVGSSISKSGAGDILVADRETAYKVQGFPLYINHSYFDPRRDGYTLLCESMPSPDPGAKRPAALRKRTPTKPVWARHIPITGKAMAKGADTLLVAGEPMRFEQPTFTNYDAAYRGELGGRLLAVDARDGTILAEHELDAAPAWDGLAIADGAVFLALEDGTVRRLGP